MLLNGMEQLATRERDKCKTKLFNWNRRAVQLLSLSIVLSLYLFPADYSTKQPFYIQFSSAIHHSILQQNNVFIFRIVSFARSVA